jgi:hypothetical protein
MIAQTLAESAPHQAAGRHTVKAAAAAAAAAAATM